MPRVNETMDTFEYNDDFKDRVFFSPLENLAIRWYSCCSKCGRPELTQAYSKAKTGVRASEILNLFLSSLWVWPLGGGDEEGKRPRGIPGLGIDYVTIPSQCSPLTACSSSLAGKEVWSVILVYGLYLYAEEFTCVWSLWLMFVQDIITENYVMNVF